MAKRTPNRTQADDAGTAVGAETPRKPRGSAGRTSPSDVGAMAGGQDQAGAMSDEFLGEGQTAGAPVQSESQSNVRSTSMGSEPSEEDIRLRAYHRYLERGGGHGRDYDDWLEAERELKGRRE
jgi:Protein of unknown function (DUF2934)